MNDLSSSELELINKMDDQLESHITELENKVKEIRAVLPGGIIDIKTIKLVHNATLIFEMKAGRLLRSCQIKYESDPRWASLLRNLGFLIEVINSIIGSEDQLLEEKDWSTYESLANRDHN